MVLVSDFYRRSKLTLNKCMDICRSSKATAAQLQVTGNQDDLTFVADGKQKGKSLQDSKLPAKGSKSVKSCKFCGHMRSRAECPV